MLQWKILLPWALDPSARGETASLVDVSALFAIANFPTLCSTCARRRIEPISGMQYAHVYG